MAVFHDQHHIVSTDRPDFSAHQYVDGLSRHDRPRGRACAHGSQILLIGAAAAAWASRGSEYAASMVARTV